MLINKSKVGIVFSTKNPRLRAIHLRDPNAIFSINLRNRRIKRLYVTEWITEAENIYANFILVYKL
jgi:hypothetical protein